MNLNSKALHDSYAVLADAKMKLEKILGCTVDLDYRIISSLSGTSNLFKLDIDTIVSIVCETLGVVPQYIKTKSRQMERVRPRQICMSLCVYFGVASLKTIGNYFGGRDHTTVIHARKTVADLLITDRNFEADYMRCMDKCMLFKSKSF